MSASGQQTAMELAANLGYQHAHRSHREQTNSSISEEEIKEVMEACNRDNEQLRILYTAENDRLRRRLAAISKVLRTSLQIIEFFAGQMTQCVKNEQEGHEQPILQEKRPSGIQSSGLQDSRQRVT